MNRITKIFNELKAQNKKAFTAFVTAGDPDYNTSLEIVKSLPANGVDIIEVGIPFLDPAGDGPTIEAASKRAIQNGMNLRKTIGLVTEFRKENSTTPIVLMGYYNPILHYGTEKFCVDAKAAGVDGILIVDLPPEEDKELREFAVKNELGFIKLVSLTSDEERVKLIARNASGFLYLVSILGITGTKSADLNEVENHLKIIRKVSDLPIMVGFGIKDKQQVQEIYKTNINGIVVGSALVSVIENALDKKIDYKSIPGLVAAKAKELTA